MAIVYPIGTPGDGSWFRSLDLSWLFHMKNGHVDIVDAW